MNKKRKEKEEESCDQLRENARLRKNDSRSRVKDAKEQPGKKDQQRENARLRKTDSRSKAKDVNEQTGKKDQLRENASLEKNDSSSKAKDVNEQPGKKDQQRENARLRKKDSRIRAKDAKTQSQKNDSRNTNRKKDTKRQEQSQDDDEEEEEEEEENTQIVHPITQQRSDEEIMLLLSMRTPPAPNELLNYRKDPLMAQQLFWERTGIYRFEYGDSVVRDPDALLEEIKLYEVTENDVRRCISNYKAAMDHDSIMIYYCGCCGAMIIRDKSQDSTTQQTEVSLSKLNCLQLLPIEYDLWIGREDRIKRLFSVYVNNELLNEAYHLIPDLVFRNMKDDSLYVHACPDCQKSIIPKGDVPLRSVAKGVDFGCLYKSGLPELSLVEKCLVAQVRIYADIVKLRAPENLSDNTRLSALKGHCIAMRHTGALQVATVLPRLTVDDFIVVYFIGGKDQWKTICNNWKNNSVISNKLRVRPDVIMGWLNLWREVNPFYGNFPLLELTQLERDTLLDIPEKLLAHAHVADDERTMRLERYSTSSTAPTVPDNNHSNTSNSPADSSIVDENERTLDSVLLDERDHGNPPGEAEVLQAVRKALQMANDDTSCLNITDTNSDTAKVTRIEIKRDGVLLNEYTENHDIFYLAFPWLFPFGKGFPTNGPASKSYVQFILQHYNKSFAEEHKLIFLLWNQLTRHTSSRMCSARMYSKKRGVQSLINTLNEDTFDADLTAALKDPKSARSTALLNRLLPHIKTCGSRVPFGPIERQEAKYKLYAMLQYFGLPSTFLTVTPNEIHSPLCIRLCKRDGCNWTTLTDITLLTVEQRAFLSSRNPVAAALFYERIIRMTVKHLLGVDMSATQKTTAPLGSREKGLLSYLVAYFGVNECQGRGTLHDHMYTWGGLPPYLLQKCAEYDNLVAGIRRVLDSMYTAEISKEGYDASLVRSGNAPSTRFYPSLYECPAPTPDGNWKTFFEKRSEEVGTAVQVHCHTFTCHKGKAGRHGCRMAFPQSIHEASTGPVELVPHIPSFTIGGVEIKEDKVFPKALPCITPLILKPEMQSHYPLYHADSRILVWELKRALVGTDTSYHYHKKNRWVVPYCKGLSAAFGSNTAAYQLGSAEQAKGTLYYTIDYMMKDPTALANIVSLISEARAHTSKYRSSAEDYATSERQATHFLSRIINNITTKAEVSVTMAAAALLGMTSINCSHNFQYVFIEAAITFAKQQILTLARAATLSGINIDFHLETNIEDNDEDGDNDEIEDSPDDEKAAAERPPNNEAGQLYCVKGEYISIQHHIHYAYRGEALKTLCFQEYICIVQVMPKQTKKIKQKGQQTQSNTSSTSNTDSLKEDEDDAPTYIDPVKYKNGRYKFDSRHPLYATHVQMARSTLAVPILAGKTPPQLPVPTSYINPAWLKRAHECAEYYITLFDPWDIDTLVPSTYPLTSDGFQQMSSEWKRTDNSFLNKCKFASINNMARSITSSYEKRKLLNQWRARSQTQWNDKDSIQEAINEGALDIDGPSNDSVMDGDYNIEAIMHALTVFSQRITPDKQKALNYIKNQKEALDKVFDEFTQHKEVAQGVEVIQNSQHDIISNISAGDVTAVTKSISNTIPYPIDEHELTEEQQLQQQLQSRPQQLDATPDPDLGIDQNLAFTQILQYVQNVSNGMIENQMLLIIHGGPGVGKSTFARALTRRLNNHNLDMICCAPTGIAASLLIDGRTCHSLFAIPKKKENEPCTKPLKPLSTELVLTLRNRFAKCVVLLIDETSMIDPIFLWNINIRLQQIKGNTNLPFGGLAVLLLGDFFQLPPVTGNAFYVAARNNIPDKYTGTIYEFGLDILKQFKIITFSHQYRSEDEQHTARINHMRDTTTNNPVDQSMIDSFQILSSHDVETDPSWLAAPIVVASNAERHALNVTQAQRYAMEKGLPVLRWKRPLAIAKDLGDPMCDLLYDNEPTLTGLFVEGAPAILTENLNATDGLANGTPLVLHSVMLSEHDDSEMFRDLVSNAQPGTIIDIPVPYAVIASIPNDDPGWPEKWNLKHKSLVDGQVVLPFVNKRYRKDTIKLAQDQTLAYKSHGIDLAFAITYHKVQGQTKRKVILDLNQRPARLSHVDYHGLYVGWSRVKFADNIRVLPCQLNDNFQHLLKLKPNIYLKQWLDTIPQLHPT
jgi:hypothetical protein